MLKLELPSCSLINSLSLLEGSRFSGAVVRAGVGSNFTENQQCGSPATAAQSVEGAVIEFLCDPPVMAKYVSLDIDLSRPGVTAEAVLQIAEVAVEEYTSGATNKGNLLRGRHSCSYLLSPHQ